jgi:hypothetical protein
MINIQTDITTNPTVITGEVSLVNTVISTVVNPSDPAQVSVDLNVFPTNIHTDIVSSTVEIATEVVGLGPKGDKGDKGDPGGETIGGYDVEIPEASEGDVLIFHNSKWRNFPKENLVDGGHF